jgi:dUTP pyrophosphatase
MPLPANGVKSYIAANFITTDIMSKRLNTLDVQITTCHPDAEIPEYQEEGDVGMDLKATEKIKDTTQRLWFKTGLKIAIPEGYAGLIFPRSSITELNLELGNAVGVLDPGFRGEVQVRFNASHLRGTGGQYQEGDRVAQLIINRVPHVRFHEVESLDETERGEGGFGHTGT